MLSPSTKVITAKRMAQAHLRSRSFVASQQLHVTHLVALPLRSCYGQKREKSRKSKKRGSRYSGNSSYGFSQSIDVAAAAATLAKQQVAKLKAEESQKAHQQLKAAATRYPSPSAYRMGLVLKHGDQLVQKDKPDMQAVHGLYNAVKDAMRQTLFGVWQLAQTLGPEKSDIKDALLHWNWIHRAITNDITALSTSVLYFEHTRDIHSSEFSRAAAVIRSYISGPFEDIRMRHNTLIALLEYTDKHYPSSIVMGTLRAMMPPTISCPAPVIVKLKMFGLSLSNYERDIYDHYTMNSADVFYRERESHLGPFRQHRRNMRALLHRTDRIWQGVHMGNEGWRTVGNFFQSLEQSWKDFAAWHSMLKMDHRHYCDILREYTKEVDERLSRWRDISEKTGNFTQAKPHLLFLQPAKPLLSARDFRNIQDGLDYQIQFLQELRGHFEASLSKLASDYEFEDMLYGHAKGRS